MLLVSQLALDKGQVGPYCVPCMDTLTPQELGFRVLRLRRERRWTQSDLGRRARVAPKTVGRLERGQHMPDVVTLAAVAAALGVTVQDLLAPVPVAAA